MALREKRCTACRTLFLLETPHQRPQNLKPKPFDHP